MSSNLPAKGSEIRAFLAKSTAAFSTALATTDDKQVNAWVRVVMSTVQNPASKLRECEPLSVIQACMYAAQLKLSVDPLLGEAWLIPRMNRKLSPARWQCNMQIGANGLRKLAMRSGRVKGAIKCEVIKEEDYFIYEEADGSPSITWRPNLKVPDRGKVIGAWAVANFIDGGRLVRVIDRNELDRAKKKSEAGRKDQGPWSTDYEAMCRKTVLSRLCRELPLDEDSARMVQRDIESDATPDAVIDTTQVRAMLDVPEDEAPSGLDALAEAEEEGMPPIPEAMLENDPDASADVEVKA